MEIQTVLPLEIIPVLNEPYSVFYYFSVERLFVFIQKLDIARRWVGMDKIKGTEIFNSVVHTLKDEIRVPDEFLVK